VGKLQESNAPVEIAESRFLTEIATLADRSSIDEELTRLASHLSQLDDILNEDEPVGRKLDFLVQELNREANTIGSKSTDQLLAKLVVELKSEIEKIPLVLGIWFRRAGSSQSSARNQRRSSG
jgi:uncharacterized protein (TIGR00255 family)